MILEKYFIISHGRHISHKKNDFVIDLPLLDTPEVKNICNDINLFVFG